MLDSSMIEQLKEVFSKLENPVQLEVSPSESGEHAQLVELLEEVASASNLLQVTVQSMISSEDGSEVRSSHKGFSKAYFDSKAPRFRLIYKGSSNGILFRGIPGGHEFSSLILSILYSDGKGKLPDAGIIKRIRGLKGPIRLRTYISLSCENCPEVVQSLNLMATLHSDFQHEMVDGGFAQNEVESLGIQGVPSVIHENQLIHSGKIQLLELLVKLEAFFGQTLSSDRAENLGRFDVAVIGGGPAGASAAIYSARKGLRTALISEKMGGQLQETKGIENMISIPYTEGVRLAAELNQHVLKYPVEILEHRRVSQISGNTEKRVQIDGGEFLEAQTIIIATGAKWRQLGIPGEREYIGQGVGFCAHCDGPFYKQKKVAVVGGGNSGVEAAIDLAGIANEVILLEYAEKLRADGVLVEKLNTMKQVTILTAVKSTQVIGDGKKVVGLEYLDLKTNQLHKIDLDGIFVQIGLLPNTQFVQGLIELTPFGEIVVDAKGRTSRPGIYAAGDVTTVPFKQIVIAMGEGAKVALTAFEDRVHAPI